MIPVTPEQTAILQVLNRLANPGDGLNATFNAMAPIEPFSITSAALTSMQIDFASPQSKNFVLGNLDFSDVEETSPFKYPLVMLYTTSSSNQNNNKFQAFSGPVNVGIDVFLSWKNNGVLRDYESYANCVISAVYTIMNRSRQGVEADQNWSAEVVYNGDIGSVKSLIKRAGDNWLQRIKFTMAFEVDQ